MSFRHNFPVIDRTMMATRWPCWDQHGRARIRTREESLRHTFRACRPLRHGTHRDKFSLIRPPNHLAVCGGLEKSWQICGKGMEMLLNIASLVVPDGDSGLSSNGPPRDRESSNGAEACNSRETWRLSAFGQGCLPNTWQPMAFFEELGKFRPRAAEGS